MTHTLKTLRQQAIASSLFPPVGLQEAVQQLGFVQADPIRAPARAQDLILRHRVQNYRVGDLDRHYPTLPLEEDFLYAYGFMPKSTWQLVHPRTERELSTADRRVFDLVAANPLIHPRQIETYLGSTREINDWGGFSIGSTRSLQTLHQQGLLRVGRRENGVKLYEIASHQHTPVHPEERMRQLVLLIAKLFNPLSDRSLGAIFRYTVRNASALGGTKSIVTQLINTGELEHAVVDGVRYAWPASALGKSNPNETVRFLAPFDPLVGDRQRFEHFWGWQYRFEAYSPPAKRQMGYYALPMLWRDEMVGWVTVSTTAGNLIVEPGFKNDSLLDDTFFTEYEAEVERLRFFLQK